MFKTVASIRTATAALAAGMLAVATPALAETPVAAVVTPAPAAPVDSAKTVSKTTRYCFAEVQTGSILRRNVCKTHADWLRAGVEPLNYMH